MHHRKIDCRSSQQSIRVILTVNARGHECGIQQSIPSWESTTFTTHVFEVPLSKRAATAAQ
jgi:hypothetical protein